MSSPTYPEKSESTGVGVGTGVALTTGVAAVSSAIAASRRIAITSLRGGFGDVLEGGGGPQGLLLVHDVGDRDVALLAGGLVLGGDVQDAVGVQPEGDVDLRLHAGKG